MYGLFRMLSLLSIIAWVDQVFFPFAIWDWMVGVSGFSVSPLLILLRFHDIV